MRGRLRYIGCKSNCEQFIGDHSDKYENLMSQNSPTPSLESAAAQAWAPYLSLLVATLLCLFPFSGRAFSTDDPLFIWTAQNIGVSNSRLPARTQCRFNPPLAVGCGHVLVYRVFELDRQREKHTTDGACDRNFARTPIAEFRRKSDPAIEDASCYWVNGMWHCIALASAGGHRIGKLSPGRCFACR